MAIVDRAIWPMQWREIADLLDDRDGRSRRAADALHTAADEIDRRDDEETRFEDWRQSFDTDEDLPLADQVRCAWQRVRWMERDREELLDALTGIADAADRDQGDYDERTRAGARAARALRTLVQRYRP